jgi:hypothetical protein
MPTSLRHSEVSFEFFSPQNKRDAHFEDRHPLPCQEGSQQLPHGLHCMQLSVLNRIGRLKAPFRPVFVQHNMCITWKIDIFSPVEKETNNFNMAGARGDLQC